MEFTLIDNGDIVDSDMGLDKIKVVLCGACEQMKFLDFRHTSPPKISSHDQGTLLTDSLRGL